MAIPDGLSFDELNKLYEEEHDLRSMPFRQFFGEMDLSREQKEKRIQAARDIQRFTKIALMSMYYMRQEGAYDYDYAASEMVKSYNSLIDRLAIPLTAYFLAMHVEDTVAEITSATINHPDDPYFFSNDRATLIAENEANAIYGDSEYADAILTGKTQKTWHAIIDKRTRETHAEVNGTTLPIDIPFEVGDSLLQYPLDTSLGASAEEIVNCRCSASYF